MSTSMSATHPSPPLVPSPPSPPSPPSVRVPLVAVAIGLLVMMSSLASGQRGKAAAELESSRAQELRAELHELQRARSRLTAARNVAISDASLDAVRIGILDAVRALDATARVRVLGYRLLDGDAEAGDARELRSVRLVIELRAAHAVRLVRALDTLRAATPAWPVEVGGCRIDRANTDGASADDASHGDEDHALIAACALDWFWWPT